METTGDIYSYEGLAGGRSNESASPWMVGDLCGSVSILASGPLQRELEELTKA